MAFVLGTSVSETIDSLDGVTNGADTIYGFDGHDTIFGLGGADQIRGGWGADTINGGNGSDTAVYDDSPVGVLVSLVTGRGFNGTAEGDTLTSIENLTGSFHPDWLVGDGGANRLSGLGDSDFLDGGDGADTLYGGSGNDTLKGGGGADTLSGGPGIDTASYHGSGSGVLVDLQADLAVGGDATGDDLSSIENVTGSAHDDVLRGDGLDNVLKGKDGDDTLKGSGGADTLEGGDGDDELAGGPGVDTMIGGDGADTFWVEDAGDIVSDASIGTLDAVYTTTSYTLTAGADIELFRTTDDDGLASISLTGNGSSQEIMGNAGANAINGGAGSDTLWGLGGDDAFVFDAPLGASNIDVIADYDLDDLIALDHATFAGLATTGDGHLAAASFTIGPAATNANQKIIYDSVTGRLYYDADGNGAGAQVHFANVTPGTALNSDEFIIV